MACCSQLIVKNKRVITPTQDSVVSYKDGQDGIVEVKYLDSQQIRIVGCKTKHVYLFENYMQRYIDYNDALCIFDKLPGLFEEVVILTEVVEDVASDNSTD